MAPTTPQRHVTQRPRPLLSWQDALAILETTDVKGVPKPFSLVFVTADEGRKTGGEVVRYDNAIWHVAGGRAMGKRAQPPATTSGNRTRSGATTWTRNIRAVDSPEVRQVHLHLILSINGQDVR